MTDQNRPIQISGHIILFVGRLMPIKNLENLIRAFRLVSVRDPTSNLVIVGEGPSKKDLISLTKKLDLEQKVLFTGAMRYEDLPGIYNMADVFVLPSLYESFSLVVLEAAACGVPIVISDEAEAIIQTIGSDALFRVNPHSIDSISQGILSALSCGKNCKITDLALQRVLNLDWDQNARLITKIYESVINP
jgi:glycosyltransferase involved in cell wall biosynthesis